MIHLPGAGMKKFTDACDGIIGGKISGTGRDGLVVLLPSSTSTYFGLRAINEITALYYSTRTACNDIINLLLLLLQ
jgi:hypothetical protein